MGPVNYFCSPFNSARHTAQLVLRFVGRPVFPSLSFGMASHDRWMVRSLLRDKLHFVVFKLEGLSEHRIAR